MRRINSHNKLQESNLAFLLYRLLSKHGLKICQSELKILLNAHYAFPGPLSISEILDDLELEHEVFYLTNENASELEKLPLPLLCYEKSKNEYSLIESIDRSKSSYKLVNRRKDIIDFHKDLILIAVFVDEDKKHAQMLKKCETFKLQKSFIFVCFVFLLVFVFTYWGHNKSSFAFWTIYLIINICGLLNSWLLIKLDVDSKNMSFLTRKVCINNRYFNCQTVSQSLRLPLLEKIGISMAEIGFLYFTVGLIYGLFHSVSDTFSLAWPMAIATVCGIPAIIGLLIYQVVSVRKICLLCLTIYFLVALELILYIRFDLFSTNIQWIDFVYFSLCCFLTLMVFFLLKLFSVHRSQYESGIIAQRRILNNPLLIDKILETSKKINYSIENFDLVVGDKNATYKILLVPDMRCYSCAEILKSTLNLIKKHRNCVLIIRFFLFREKINKLDTNVIQVVFAIAQKYNSQEALNFLIGWLKTYPKDELEFEKYTCKQTYISNSVNIDHQISFYKQWSTENNLIRTPLLVINGHELPNLLNIEDLKYYFIRKHKNE